MRKGDQGSNGASRLKTKRHGDARRNGIQITPRVGRGKKRHRRGVRPVAHGPLVVANPLSSGLRSTSMLRLAPKPPVAKMKASALISWVPVKRWLSIAGPVYTSPDTRPSPDFRLLT